MNHQRAIRNLRQRRKFRVRKRIVGTAERPRLSVFRSHKHIYVQLINDFTGHTIVSASTADKSLAKSIGYGGNIEAAAKVGQLIAERALAAGVKKASFDRGPFKYHGRVAAIAEAARQAGLDLGAGRTEAVEA